MALRRLEKISDNYPILLPLHLKSVWPEEPDIDESLVIELQMSSIILSTNAFGDFSKCTIVSELIDDKKMGHIVIAARKLWQKFIHQPQTARCLVFLLILGEICQKLARDYKEAIKVLKSVLKLDVSCCDALAPL